MHMHFYSAENLAIPLAANDGSQRLVELARPTPRPAPRDNGRCRFDIYRAERVSVTSSLWAGGDWHWRLSAPSGTVLVDCGGYRDEEECLAAVNSLRTEAGTAIMSMRH